MAWTRVGSAQHCQAVILADRISGNSSHTLLIQGPQASEASSRASAGTEQQMAQAMEQVLEPDCQVQILHLPLTSL